MSHDTPSFAAASLCHHPLESVTSRSWKRKDMARTSRSSKTTGADPRGDTATALSAPDSAQLSTPLSNSPSLSPRSAQSKISRPHSKRRRARSYLSRWRNFTSQNGWINPLIVILITIFLYALNPSESNPIHPFLCLSYPLPPGHPFIPAHARSQPDVATFYGKGPRDFLFVAFYIIVLTFTREFFMQRRILRQWAIFCGMRSRGMQNRHMEQVYTAIYFAVFGPVGTYVMYRTPVWYFDSAGMFAEFPHRSHDAIFKAYYLIQASYWAQQAIVLVMLQEKPRKDFKELVAHHIVTLALIWLSYRFHFTYMGVAVYVTHDVSDFFLAACKTFNYMHHPIIIPWFTFFVGVWVYLRHYINLRILYSMFTDFKTVGPFTLNWETEQYKCWISQYITFSLLAALQCINLFWLYCILRIALNVVLKDDGRDVRSDDEEVEEQGSYKKHIKAGTESLAASGVGSKQGMNGGLNGGLKQEERLNGELKKER